MQPMEKCCLNLFDLIRTRDICCYDTKQVDIRCECVRIVSLGDMIWMPMITMLAEWALSLSISLCVSVLTVKIEQHVSQFCRLCFDNALPEWTELCVCVSTERPQSYFPWAHLRISEWDLFVHRFQSAIFPALLCFLFARIETITGVIHKEVANNSEWKIWNWVEKAAVLLSVWQNRTTLTMDLTIQIESIASLFVSIISFDSVLFWLLVAG